MKTKSKRIAYLGPEGTHSEQACIVYDASTSKFEASSGIDGGYYG